MVLWLALCLPALPLQLAERALETAHPTVIVAGPSQRPVIAFCNAPAQQAGIHAGQKLAAARAIARELHAVVRQPELEETALHELACWAYQFSGWVSPRQTPTESGLLIETGGSARLFEGQARLQKRIVAGLRDLGYRASFGCAPTPRGAWLLGQARLHGLVVDDITDAAALPAALAPLPLALTGWDPDALAKLDALGLATLGDVLRLPRDAFNKRFGTALLRDLDQALDQLPDPQPPFAPPERFEARIELPADLCEAAQLMFPAHRLLRSLEGFLRGRDCGTSSCLFSVHHSPRRMQTVTTTQIRLNLAAPERNAGRLARLLREHLERLQLPEPAVMLTLTVEQLQRYTPGNVSLLPPSPVTPLDNADWLRLAELLHARLGSERVFQFRLVDDCRPEHAQQIVPLQLDAGDAPPPLARSQRPLLLLSEPCPLPAAAEQPQCDGPLTLITGPERIESGWWDFARRQRGSVHRDYFVARNPGGQMLWIFRELTAPRGWFLHGLFA
jgi:protein ImuB